jgi:LysM repeat protein
MIERRGANTMKSHRYLVVFVVILIALTLAACERSASTPPPTDGNAFPTLEGTQNPMDELGAFATQTAAAQVPEGEAETQPDGEVPTQVPPTEEPQPEEGGQEAQTTSVPPKDYPVPDSYTLQKGEFPFCIARRFNISPGALLAANSLTSSSVTYAGQTLTIPKNAGAFDAGARALKSHPDTYTIQAGDTVYSVACLYGNVDPRAIEEANGLNGAYTLQVGNSLQIP